MCRTILRTHLCGSLATLALLAAGCADRTPPLEPGDVHPVAAPGGPHVVHVAPPAGDAATDRGNVLAALEEVRPGGTVQFAPGTYVLDTHTAGAWNYLEVTVPRVALLGHPDGTTIRGCDEEPQDIANGACVGFELSGGHQTVRNLHFQDMFTALVLGKDVFLGGGESRTGGYRVEGNSFRDITWGISVYGQWTQPAVIRNNSFTNLLSGVDVWGRTVHVTDNEFSAPEWERIPVWFGAIYGISLIAWNGTGPSEHNLIARNRIEGFVDALAFEVLGAGAPCRFNVLRDNTIVDSREYTPGNGAAPVFLFNRTAAASFLSDNLIQGNRMHGSFGNGVIIFRGERNRVVNNVISDIQITLPFQPWLGESNGSGVWVSSSGRGNQILGNTFSDVEAAEVVLEGDHNHVATRSASDVVRDLGIGNRVTGPGTVVTTAAPAGARAGVTTAVAERAEAVGTLRERVGARSRMLEEGWREAAPR